MDDAMDNRKIVAGYGGQNSIYPYHFFIRLGDVGISMKTYGVGIDIDVAQKCDVFRFATAEPMEDVEILLPWGSYLSQAMQGAVETMESLIKAKRDSLHGEKQKMP